MREAVDGEFLPRVALGKMLTAQHVVERGHRAGASSALRIRVLLDEDGGGRNVVAGDTTVAWAGETRLDPRDCQGSTRRSAFRSSLRAAP